MGRGGSDKDVPDILYGEHARSNKFSESAPQSAQSAPGFDPVENSYVDGSGAKYLNIHPYTDDCDRYGCIIHSPSDHHMRDWPTLVRTLFGSDRGLMERTCPHGIGHPDPDNLGFIQRTQEDASHAGVHGCDGCCTTP